MSMLVRFAPHSLSAEQYDGTIRELNEAGDFPPDGMELHVCFGSGDGDLRISEIWESKEKFEAFGLRLMPVLGKARIIPGEPEILEILEIHNMIQP